jgi:sec-independent protein translocase protein TatC
MSDSLESHFLELKQRLIKSVIFFVVAFCCLYPFNNTFFNLLSEYIFIIPDFELIAVEVASPFLVPLRLTAFSFAVIYAISYFPAIYVYGTWFI